MSNNAVMPLEDYVAACDTIREKTGVIPINIDKQFSYDTAIHEYDKELGVGTLIAGQKYNVVYDALSVNASGEYIAENVVVKGASTVGITIELIHPADDSVYNVYIYQFEDKIMAYGSYFHIVDEFGLNISINSIDSIVSGELPGKIEEVYEAGKNVDWNEIKGTANGSGVVHIDDVSLIEHEMDVKVSGVEDFSAVIVKRYDKNLIDYKKAEPRTIGQTVTIDEENKSVDWSGDYFFKIPLGFTIKKGTKIAFSCASSWFLRLGYENASGEDAMGVATSYPNDGVYRRHSVSELAPIDIDSLNIYKQNVSNFDNDMVFADIQLEIGNSPIEYEDYIQPTEYTPDENGIVNGVISIYPCTTLTTDTDGVLIEVTYNKDISKVENVPERIEAVYDEGITNGKQQGTDEFLDLLTNYGNRGHYGDTFRESSFEYIRPNYKIVPTEAGSALRTFTSCKSLKKLESDYFDFSQFPRGTTASAGFYNTFSTCSVLEEIEDIGIRGQKYFNSTFSRDYALKKIARIGVDEDSVFSSAFYMCEKLEDVTFDGVIGQSGLDFQWSKNLSKKTWQNIIDCLSSTTSQLSITGSLESVQKAFETSKGANDGDTSPEWEALESSKTNWIINLV